MYENTEKIYDFVIFYIFAKRASSVIAGKLLTSLKLFVEKKYLKSRRAHRASTKASKVKNALYVYTIGVKYARITRKW